ncbi:MAG TPA: hypothetical protein VN887_20055 [Candidatus Angelobacter sp.]|nr:hypothetical protein [Candidatus Angelobacter sp.]
MKLSTLAIILGLGVGLPQIYGLMHPTKFRDAVRKFPRSETIGYFLMLLGTVWFLWNLNQENISDFAAYKKAMLIGFAAVGVATCIYVRDFLAVRGLAIVLLLLAKLMVDTARWADTEWRLVVVTWAYVLVVAGMWFTISPWRLRDLLNWATATDQRVRVGCGLRLAFGLFVVVLGLAVFRPVELKAGPQAGPTPDLAR